MTVFAGQAPATLELQQRSDGSIRLRVERVGSTDVSLVDLAPAKVDELIAKLTEMRNATST